MNQLDKDFKYRIQRQAGGENITRCFSCGICTGACPVSRVYPSFSPAKIIMMILWGMKEELLSSDLPWYCLTCFNCSFHCPQDVRFAEVMKIVREMAVSEGYVDPSCVKNMDYVQEALQLARIHLCSDILSKKKESYLMGEEELKQCLPESLEKSIRQLKQG